ncbi:MAG: FG-GAP-like repeat-containing protein, partial [Saprospiraceae bacterium]|nr:FG-GAP-like repeat-containing protein [Saprospiraceae bacterium]
MKKTITLLLLSMVPGLLCAQPPFENITNLAGVANLGERNRGSCLIDFDNDGDVDLYTYTRNSYHHLFENNGAGQFTDITEELGLHQSYQSRVVTWGDLNNDGWLDLYIGNFNSPDVIYLNNGPDNQGQFSFTDVTANSGISQNNFEDPKAVLMADYDQDGDLDIYLSNFNDQNRLYRNNGDLTFTDVVYEAGVTDIQMSMSAIFFDYDNDHDVDLYLVHDFDIPNILYRNDGNGQFTDVSAEAGVDYAGDGMGVDAADINRDGFLDLYVSNLYENVLFLNNGDGTFTDISQSAGVDDYGMAWGTFFLDYNNDGWSDIYVINDSHFSDYPNVLYTNLQDNTFQISGGNSVVADEGAGFGGGIGDINGDGKLDILIANTDPDEGNVLLQNNTFDRNWIGFHLRGNRSNRFAVGAKVHIFYNQQQQLDEIHAGTGFASQNEYRLHFGLHQATLVDSVRIIWPNGQQQMLYELPVNQNYTIEEMNFPIIRSIVANDTVVPAHDKFELEVELEASFDNPFDYEQVHLRAEFTAPGGQTYLVDGFYMQEYQLQTTNGQLIPEGEGTFKLRFTPTIPGEWTYRLSVQDSIGTAFSQIGHFACSSNASRGFVRSSSSNYLKFENGEAFIPIGENIAWPNGNPYTNYKAWLSKLAENNGNFFRIWDAHWGLGLEWNAAYPGYSGLKQYQQENARYLDWLVEYCREQDLYLMFCLQHHGQMSNSVNPNWSGNPYNMANGGMCESPTDFFAQAKAKKTLQNKWRYCLARWGYSPQLMAWELFNEVDWTDDFQNIQNIIQDWHLEMAAWIKENDPHKHLVTTSFANPAYDPQIWNQPDIDFTQTHFYLNIPNLEQVLVDGVRDYLADYQKPTLTGEFGLGSNLNLA